MDLEEWEISTQLKKRLAVWVDQTPDGRCKGPHTCESEGGLRDDSSDEHHAWALCGRRALAVDEIALESHEKLEVAGALRQSEDLPELRSGT